MSVQEHFHVFETLLYGLAIAHILIGLSKMLDHRKTIRFYWLHLLMVLTILMTISHRYFIAFEAPSFAAIHYAYEFLLLIFLPLTCLFFITYQLIPNKVEGVDFKEFLWERSTILLSLNVVFLILLVYRNFIEFSIFFKGEIPSTYMVRGIYSIIGFTFLMIMALIINNRVLISLVIIILFLFVIFLIATAQLGW